jgi:c-di-GMP-binding flagellar brake protein YcgR
MMDFLHDFSIEYKFDNVRRAYRVRIPGLYAELEGFEERFPVLDISSAGIAVSLQKRDERLKMGHFLKLSLYLKERLLLQDLQAEIIRFMDNGMALEFSGLSLRQEARLDKIVLESQKQMIEMKKKMSQQDDESTEA